jgi:hypothetical protein
VTAYDKRVGQSRQQARRQREGITGTGHDRRAVRHQRTGHAHGLHDCDTIRYVKAELRSRDAVELRQSDYRAVVL